MASISEMIIAIACLVVGSAIIGGLFIASLLIGMGF